mgnify:CR=1 FL=1
MRDYLIKSIHPGNDEFAHVLGKSAWSVNEEMIDEDAEAQVWLRGGETVCPIPPDEPAAERVKIDCDK